MSRTSNERQAHLDPLIIRLADKKSFAGSRDFGIEIRTRIETASPAFAT